MFVALDFAELDEALRCVQRLAPLGARFKVGLELFCRWGPEGVRRLQALGGPVLLDLKLHDIPRTVQRAVAALATLGCWGVTLHASGGPAMLRAAVQAARAASADPPPHCLAVTVLTSLDASVLQTLGVCRPLPQQVAALAAMAQRAGCDGVVASPAEVAAVRAATLPPFLVLTPGVRPEGAPADDQARVASPSAAVRAGADFLVVGRPVTEAADPAQALGTLLQSVGGAESGGQDPKQERGL